MTKESEIFGKFIIKSLHDGGLNKLNKLNSNIYKDPINVAYQNRIKESSFTKEQKELINDILQECLKSSIGVFLHAIDKGKYSVIKKEDNIDIYKIINKDIVDKIFEGENTTIVYKKWREEYSHYNN